MQGQGDQGEDGDRHLCEDTKQPVPEQALWDAYRASRSVDARNALIEFYLPLVQVLADKIFARFSDDALVERDDLVHDAIPALMGLLDTFDPVRRIKFTSYMTRRLIGAMIDEVRRRDWVPRSERESCRDNPDHPLIRMLPLEFNLTDPAIARIDGSIDGWIDDEHFWSVVCRGLGSVDRVILLLYFREGLSLEQIGTSLHRSESRMSQRLTDILQRLRNRQDLDDAA